MNLITKLFLPSFLLTVYSLFGQTSNTKVKLDSSLTLTKRLQQDKLDIGLHGVFFNERTKHVFNDFKTIQALGLTDLSKYQKQVVQEHEHLIKIWTEKTPSENVSTIIEINSVYLIDTTNDDSRLKDTIIYNDYFFQLKDKLKMFIIKP